MADNNTIARPYAEALFEVAQENAALEAFSASLQAGAELLNSHELIEFLGNPALNNEQRLEFLQGLFAEAAGGDSALAGGSQHGTNFLKLLLENHRINVLPEISDHFDALKAKIENKVDVVVRSATRLTDAQIAEMATALTARLGHDVSIETEIDESLIGGAVITAGDVVIDGSTRSRLEGLANALAK